MSNARFGLRVRNGLISNIIQTPIDSDAAQFILVAGITNLTQISAINQLVTNLKTANLWYKMPFIYPFVGGTASTHRFNLRDPRDFNAAGRLNFIGGWTHTSNGAVPNGTNTYALTGFVPNQQSSVNSNGMGYYSGSDLAETSADPINMGCVNNVNTQASFVGKYNASINSRLNGAYISVADTRMKGLFSSHRTSSTLTTLYINSTPVVSGNSGGNLTSIQAFIGTITLNGTSPYGSGYVRNDFRFAYFSEGLSNDEMITLYNIIQTYQTALGREVV